MKAQTTVARTATADLAHPSRAMLLIGCFCALLLCSGTVIVFSYGVLLKPITAEFGITRTSATTALLLAQLGVALFVPIMGRLVDRFGVRTVLLPSIGAFALSIMAVGVFAQGRTSFVVLYCILGIASAGHSPTAYAKVVSSWFVRNRGMALGFVMAAIGLGGALIPPCTQWLVAHYGWRGAYVALGIGVLVIALPAVFLAVREPQTGTAEARLTLAGASSTEIWRSPDFWRMAVTFGLMGLVANGTLTQVAPMLTDRGIPAVEAAGIMGMAGFALIIGRLGAGVLLDRFSGRVVTGMVLVLMGIGVAVLATTAERSGFIAGTVLVGLGLGAEVDLLSYMLARRFGMRSFGVAHGVLIAIFSAGTGIGPFAMSASFDFAGGYTSGLLGFGISLVVAAIAIAGVRPRTFDEVEANKSHKSADLIGI